MSRGDPAPSRASRRRSLGFPVPRPSFPSPPTRLLGSNGVETSAPDGFGGTHVADLALADEGPAARSSAGQLAPSTPLGEPPDPTTCPEEFFGWDDEVDAKIPELIATQDAVILGRRSYNEAQFWASSQIEPFATFINGVEKYVATSTPLDQEWPIDGGRRRAGRIRTGPQAPARTRHRRPRQHLGRPGAARRRRRRRTHARDSADDRRPRTTTPRRLATDSARIDPKRDLTDWLPDRHYRLIREGSADEPASAPRGSEGRRLSS